MKTIRNIVISASLLAAAVGLAPAAHAYYCESGYTCSFRHANFTGGQVDFQYYIPDFDNFYFEGTYTSAGRDISSVVNNGRSFKSCLYEGKYGTGRKIFLWKGSSLSNLGNLNPSFNDKAMTGYYQSARPSC